MNTPPARRRDPRSAISVQVATRHHQMCCYSHAQIRTLPCAASLPVAQPTIDGIFWWPARHSLNNQDLLAIVRRSCAPAEVLDSDLAPGSRLPSLAIGADVCLCNSLAQARPNLSRLPASRCIVHRPTGVNEAPCISSSSNSDRIADPWRRGPVPNWFEVQQERRGTDSQPHFDRDSVWEPTSAPNSRTSRSPTATHCRVSVTA